jgi:hypothetical protein
VQMRTIRRRARIDAAIFCLGQHGGANIITETGFIFRFAFFVSPTRLNTQSPGQIPIILDSSVRPAAASSVGFEREHPLDRKETVRQGSCAFGLKH